MSKLELDTLFKEVICLETEKTKLCGRQKCIDLLQEIQKYCDQNELNISMDTLGEINNGKIYIAQVIRFYNEFLSK